MAFSEFEKARIGKLVGAFVEKRRPPAHLRSRVDLTFRIIDRSIEIFEIREPFQEKPGGKIEVAIAKSTFVKGSKVWKLYWRKQDQKWHAYEPNPFAETLEQIISIVDRDEYCCFFG